MANGSSKHSEMVESYNNGCKTVLNRQNIDPISKQNVKPL